MDNTTFFFDLVSWIFIIAPILVLIVMMALYLKDAMREAPRFKKAMRWMVLVLIIGIILLLGSFATGWMPLFIFGAATAIISASIILFVSGAFIHEATKMGGVMAPFVIGVFAILFIGILLRVVRQFLV